MSRDPWPEIDTGRCIMTGNVAKVKVLHKLYQLTSNGSELSVLDIGCVGPQPFEFWEPLLTNGSSFHITGVDVQGIEKAREIVAQQAWKDRVTLLPGSGYNLSDLFAPQSFNVVVATQVLEHLARLPLFMQQVAAVLKHNGEGFFTADSAHWQSRFDLRDPARLMKNLVKKGLGLFGNEQHYDLPWFDYEVAAACNEAGLEIVDCRYYNLSPLKFIHNHILPPNRRNSFMRLWLELEDFLNEEREVREKVKGFFLGLYFQVRKN